MSATSGFFFPDTTVLVNFALLRRLDLLISYLSGRGRMTQAVHAEVAKSSRFVPELLVLDLTEVFGDVIVLNQPEDHRGVGLMRKRFASQADPPTKHLGESETLYLLMSRPQFSISRLLTDDADAYRAAGALGLLRHHTVEIFEALIARGDVTASEAFDLITQLLADPAERSLINPPRRPQDLVR